MLSQDCQAGSGGSPPPFGVRGLRHTTAALPSAAQGCLAPKPTPGHFFSGALCAWKSLGLKHLQTGAGEALCLSQQPWQTLARADGKVTVITFMGAFIHPIISPWSEGLVRSASGWGTVQGQRKPWKWCWGNLPPAGHGHGTLLLCWDQPQHYRDPPWAPSPWAPHSPHRTPGLSECFALQELG